MKYTTTKDQKRINAIQWTGDNTEDVLSFCEGKAKFISNNIYMKSYSGYGKLIIQSKGRNLPVFKNNYIIKSKDGELYICLSDDFERKHVLAKNQKGE